jgi:hypothetical protein
MLSQLNSILFEKYYLQGVKRVVKHFRPKKILTRERKTTKKFCEVLKKFYYRRHVHVEMLKIKRRVLLKRNDKKR